MSHGTGCRGTSDHQGLSGIALGFQLRFIILSHHGGIGTLSSSSVKVICLCMRMCMCMWHRHLELDRERGKALLQQRARRDIGRQRVRHGPKRSVCIIGAVLPLRSDEGINISRVLGDKGR